MLSIQSGTFSRCHRYLDSMGKINQQNVQSLPQEVKDFLRQITPLRLKELAQMNCFAAEKVKTELDKKYGENNYVIISLGRSVSSICELMKFFGVDVKHLPMSGLRRTKFKDIQIDEHSLNVFKEYLNFIGLTKNNLEKNKEKKYILIDYTHYGRSLDETFNFLRRDDMLGPAENFIKLPVCNVLGDDYEQKGYEKLFRCSRFKDYAMVGKLCINRLYQVFKQFDEDIAFEYRGNITKGLRKLFWFNVCDSLKQQDYKNVMPNKELNAIYWHQLSPKAVQNYIKREFEKQQKIINSKK